MEALVLRLLLKNGDFGFEIGRLDIRDQAPFETGAQALFDGIDILRKAVRGNDDLLLLLVESIERVEELFLSALLAGDKLDVVDEQDVDRMEAVAEADHAVEAEGINHFNGELFGADIAEAHGGILLLGQVPGGGHEVGLAHAHAAVEEERVVGFRRLLGYGAGTGMSELIGFSDDKAFKGVAGLELVVAALEVEFGLLQASDGRGGLDGFFLGADVLHLGVGCAHLMEDGLDDLAVSAGKDLTEDRAGDLDEESVALVAVETGGLKPSGVGVDANSGLNEVEELVPDIESFRFSTKLCSSRHRNGKYQSQTISTDVKKLWKADCPKASRFWSSCPRQNGCRTFPAVPGGP